MFSAHISIWAVYVAIAYFAAFAITTGGLFIWQTKRRRDRPPEKFKLLRGPGESLRRRVQKADEDMFIYFGAAAFAPLIIVWALLAVTVWLPKRIVLATAALAVVVFAIALLVSVRCLFQFLKRRRDDFLGYLGERAVAEQLDALRSEGFRVFHDVPAEGRRKNFNIDHVVIGPTGVTAIEVKTRRKKKSRSGRAEHVVEFDGQRLIWPWGEDCCGIDQLQAEADWLRDFIRNRTGLQINPKPVLSFPGWYVTERAVGAFRIANHKMLPTITREWRPEPLTAQQIDLISRQLDERCRDVED